MRCLDDTDQARLSLPRAVALGLVQGPTELLPVSSSAHINLVPWLCGWRYGDLDPELRKSFEVALHAGAAAALLIGQRDLLGDELRDLDRRRVMVLALSFLPPAAIGYLFERPIEQRLGGPKATAVGLLVGSAAMAAADHWPGRPARASRWRAWQSTTSLGRGRGEAGAVDGLALGLAQAAALAPGVSRNGATLAAARRRGFSRDQANLLSRVVALPIITGASLLKSVRLFRRGLEPGQGRLLTAGVLASFGSTLASQRLIRLVERDRALWPYAAYRAALATLVLLRLKRVR